MLAVAGEINSVGGQPREGLAFVRLGLTGGVTNLDLGLDGYVYSVLARGSVVYFSGYFTHVLGVPRSGIAAVDPSNGTALPFNPGLYSDIGVD